MFALKVNVWKYLHWRWMFALKMFENVCAQLLNNSSSSLPPLHGSWGTEHQKMHWIVLFCNKEMPNNWKLHIYSVWTKAMHGLVQVIATLFCGVLQKKKRNVLHKMILSCNPLTQPSANNAVHKSSPTDLNNKLTICRVRKVIFI